MVVLCDTCAVLMLLRVAPEMLKDRRFGCVTIHNVWEEYTRTTELGRKYPWRDEYREHLKSISQGTLETAEFQQVLKGVTFLAERLRNARTGKAFRLSRVDQRVAAATVTLNAELCTAEHDLEDFMLEQFGKHNHAPLQLINDWLAAGLISWTDKCHAVIEDWIRVNERPQPKSEIARFEKLTKRRYPS